MPTSRDELAQLNFGYLKGSDLLQFAPSQILTSQYDKYPDTFDLGCSMAYDEIASELITRYDVQKELSNSSQILKSQTGNITITIPATGYVSRIILTWDTSTYTSLGVSTNGDISPLVSIGTTLNGTELFEDNIQYQKVVWLNRYYDTETTLYFLIEGGNVDIDLACNRTSLSPVTSVIEDTEDASFTLVIPANTYIYTIFGSILLDAPVVTVGTTLGGAEVCAQTTIAGAALVIKAGMNYFATETTLYFTVTGGTVSYRLDVGYNYVDHEVLYTQPRNSLFVKLVSIMAIRNILGSISGENKILLSHFDWLELKLQKIKEKQMSLTLSAAPSAISSRAGVISSSFRQIG
jgi:hypothetical protein